MLEGDDILINGPMDDGGEDDSLPFPPSLFRPRKPEAFTPCPSRDEGSRIVVEAVKLEPKCGCITVDQAKAILDKHGMAFVYKGTPKPKLTKLDKPSKGKASAPKRALRRRRRRA